MRGLVVSALLVARLFLTTWNHIHINKWKRYLQDIGRLPQ